MPESTDHLSERLERKLEGLASSLKEFREEVHRNLKEETRAIREEIKAETQAIRSEVKGETQAIRDEFKELRKDVFTMREDFAGHRSRNDSALQEINTKVAEIKVGAEQDRSGRRAVAIAAYTIVAAVLIATVGGVTSTAFNFHGRLSRVEELVMATNRNVEGLPGLRGSIEQLSGSQASLSGRLRDVERLMQVYVRAGQKAPVLTFSLTKSSLVDIRIPPDALIFDWPVEGGEAEGIRPGMHAIAVLPPESGLLAGMKIGSTVSLRRPHPRVPTVVCRLVLRFEKPEELAAIRKAVEAEQAIPVLIVVVGAA